MHVNLVDLVKSFPTNIYLQNLASIQKRTSPVKFAYLAEKSGEGSISNLSTKVFLEPAYPPRWKINWSMLLQEKHGKTKEKGDEDVKEIDEKIQEVLRKPEKLTDLINENVRI